jgi:hypothetical protein
MDEMIYDNHYFRLDDESKRDHNNLNIDMENCDHDWISGDFAIWGDDYKMHCVTCRLSINPYENFNKKDFTLPRWRE